MTPPAAPRVRALSIHAGYRCRDTGVCCSSGWDIPVEPEVEGRLRIALRSGALCRPWGGTPSTLPGVEEACFRSVAGLPHAARVVFAADASGRCVFLEADQLEADRRCAVHRQLGIEALASACRDFPRLVTLTPLGVSITLSHYCPTAAAMLFTRVTPGDPGPPGDGGEALSSGLPGDERRGSAVTILEDPPGFPRSWPYEGLDARGALPPLLRPGVLMDWPSLELWEAFAVSVLGDGGRTPQAALDVLGGAAEEARRWRPEDGPFGAYIQRVLSFRGAPAASGDEEPAGAEGPGMAVAWRVASECVPHRALLPPAPGGLGEAHARWVAPAWPALALPIRRWLAAKAFASWLALQGEGLRTMVLGLRIALDVLRAEAARACARAGRTLDAALLEQAVRRADLLLVHLADPDALATRLSSCERSGPAACA